jgi:6-phosphofructokinase
MTCFCGKSTSLRSKWCGHASGTAVHAAWHAMAPVACTPGASSSIAVVGLAGTTPTCGAREGMATASTGDTPALLDHSKQHGAALLTGIHTSTSGTNSPHTSAVQGQLANPTEQLSSLHLSRITQLGWVQRVGPACSSDNLLATDACCMLQRLLLLAP